MSYRGSVIDFDQLVHIIGPVCPVCNSTAYQAIGSWDTDDRWGVYIDTICLDCHVIYQDGDGEFYLYYKILPDGSIDPVNLDISMQKRCFI